LVDVNNMGPWEIQLYRGYEVGELEIIKSANKSGIEGEKGFITDFLGVKTGMDLLWPGLEHLDGAVAGLPIPGDFHAQSIEYIGMLRSVETAEGSYTAIELGAGYGPWIVGGAVAARNKGITKIHMTGLEADPGRFELMKLHIARNGFDLKDCTLVQAAVGPEAGQARWPKIGKPSHAAGGRPIRAGQDHEESDTEYAERTYEGETGIDVKIMAFDDVLAEKSFWDMVHIDIQGWEHEICAAAIERLNTSARWVIIGTHSRKIEGDLFDLFWRNGWELTNEKPCKFTYRRDRKSMERMTYTDGAQVWHNPRV